MAFLPLLGSVLAGAGSLAGGVYLGKSVSAATSRFSGELDDTVTKSASLLADAVRDHGQSLTLAASILGPDIVQLSIALVKISDSAQAGAQALAQLAQAVQGLPGGFGAELRRAEEAIRAAQADFWHKFHAYYVSTAGLFLVFIYHFSPKLQDVRALSFIQPLMQPLWTLARRYNNTLPFFFAFGSLAGWISHERWHAAAKAAALRLELDLTSRLGIGAAVCPIGTIVAFGGDITQISPGWIPCVGQQLQCNQYPVLWRIIGNRWNRPNTVSPPHFDLPDLRGAFLRGVNSVPGVIGVGMDPDVLGRRPNGAGAQDAPGSYQDDALLRHDHRVIDAGHGHGMRFHKVGRVEGPHDAYGPGGNETSHPTMDNHSNVRVAPEGTSTESRPKNFYVIWIIRVQ